MRQRTTIRSALLALLLAGTLLVGTTSYAGLQAVTDPTTAFTYRTRLPGGRALSLSKRPPCRPPLPRMRCRYDGRTTDSRLWVSYFAPATRRVEYTLRLPQR